MRKPLPQALHEVGSLPMARVHLQTSRRFWLERGHTGWVTLRVVATGWVPAHDPAGRAVVGADDDPFLRGDP